MTIQDVQRPRFAKTRTESADGGVPGPFRAKGPSGGKGKDSNFKTALRFHVTELCVDAERKILRCLCKEKDISHYLTE